MQNFSNIDGQSTDETKQVSFKADSNTRDDELMLGDEGPICQTPAERMALAEAN